MHSDPHQQLFEWRQGEASSPVASGWLSRRSARARVLLALGILVLIGVLVFVAAWEAHVSSPIYRYEQLKMGMTYEQVEDMMGSPGEVEDSLDSEAQEVRVWRYDLIFIYVTFRDGRATHKDIMNWEI